MLTTSRRRPSRRRRARALEIQPHQRRADAKRASRPRLATTVAESAVLFSAQAESRRRRPPATASPVVVVVVGALRRRLEKLIPFTHSSFGSVEVGTSGRRGTCRTSNTRARLKLQTSTWVPSSPGGASL